MSGFWAWLFGMESFPSGEVEQARLSFLYVPEGYRLLLFLLGLAAAAGFAFWIYRKRRETLGAPRRWTLTALRALAMLLFLFLLGGPVLAVVAQNTLRSTVIFLVDNSASMQLADKRMSQESLGRTAAALSLIPKEKIGAKLDAEHAAQAAKARRADILNHVLKSQEAGLLQRFPDFRVRAYTFGRDVRQGLDEVDLRGLEGLDRQLTFAEPETRLGTALSAALEDLRGQPVAGVVVLSDGACNSGQAPDVPLEAARKRDVPVYFVGIGEPDVKDVQVSFLSMRDVLFLDDPAPVTVKLRHWGCEGQEVKLVVRDGEKVLDEKNVVLQAGGEQIETLEVTPDKPGRFTYTVRAEPLAEELTEENNAKSKDVRVIDDRIKILWIESYPRWEYRYAKNLIRRDTKRFESRVLLFEADPEIRRKSGGLYLESFPREDKDLFQYHLVVVGDVESNRFGEEDLKRLKTYVSKEGGAVLFLAGAQNRPGVWKDTLLEELLPVEIGEAPPRPSDLHREMNQPVVNGYHARRTPAGKRHPLLFLFDEQERTRRAWEQDLELFHRMGVQKAKPGGLVLLESAEEKAEPLMVYSRYGSGTVIYLGTDELWRWRYKPGPVTHDRFWGNLLQQVALARLLGESRRLTLQVEREELGVGEEQTIVARALDAAYRPITDETISVKITREEEGVARETIEVPLNAVNSESGLFEGKLFPGKTGAHTVTLEHGGESVSALFRVTAPQLEFENPALDRKRLSDWAKLAGGNVYDPWDLAGLPEELRAKAKAAIVRTEDELWDAPLWAILFILLAGSEWWLRKQRNLP